MGLAQLLILLILLRTLFRVMGSVPTIATTMVWSTEVLGLLKRPTNATSAQRLMGDYHDVLLVLSATSAECSTAWNDRANYCVVVCRSRRCQLDRAAATTRSASEWWLNTDEAMLLQKPTQTIRHTRPCVRNQWSLSVYSDREQTRPGHTTGRIGSCAPPSFWGL